MLLFGYYPMISTGAPKRVQESQSVTRSLTPASPARNFLCPPTSVRAGYILRIWAGQKLPLASLLIYYDRAPVWGRSSQPQELLKGPRASAECWGSICVSTVARWEGQEDATPTRWALTVL